MDGTAVGDVVVGCEVAGDAVAGGKVVGVSVNGDAVGFVDAGGWVVGKTATGASVGERLDIAVLGLGVLICDGACVLRPSFANVVRNGIARSELTSYSGSASGLSLLVEVMK